jgi:hypothetical protein
MPLELLRAISASPMPVVIRAQEEIDKLRVLAAADMVEADIPPAGNPGAAVIRRITGYGRATIEARPSMEEEQNN